MAVVHGRPEIVRLEIGPMVRVQGWVFDDAASFRRPKFAARPTMDVAI